MQRLQQFRYGLSATGDSQVWSNLMQRNKDKSTLAQPWMGKFQSRLMNFKIVHEQDIQVKRSGTILNFI